jgi:hypothetical protein
LKYKRRWINVIFQQDQRNINAMSSFSYVEQNNQSMLICDRFVNNMWMIAELTWKGSSLSRSYDSWIYNYQCNHCLSPTLWVRIPIDVTKYEDRTNLSSTEFSLVIKNYTESNLNINYTCSCGSKFYKKLLGLNDEDFIGKYIYHQLCEFESRSWRGVLDTILYDKVCQ